VCFKVGISQVCNQDLNKEQPEQGISFMAFEKKRFDQCSEDIDKSGYSEFNQIIQILVMGRSLVFRDQF
jgi:hypothetical protein